MSSILGYLRPDINKQDAQSQLDQLKAAEACKIYQEKPSATKHSTPQLDKLMAEVLHGDTVVVTSLDCIAQNTKHLLEIVEALNAAGVTFKVIKNGIDTSTLHGEVLRMLLSAIVDFERQVVRERQSVGIAKAKLEGRYKGRKPTARMKTDEVLALNDKGLTRQKIADELGIGVASVYRILKAHTVPKTSRRKIAKKPEKTVNKQKRVERKPTLETDTGQLSFF
jgi:DNA invertase Pin-like site-specific DNA recombinase